MSVRNFDLSFGREGRFACAVDEERLLAAIEPPAPLADVAESVRAAIASPLEFPPLSQAVVEGDHVAIVLDRRTPQGAALVAGLWQVLESRGVQAEDVVVIQPADLREAPMQDPRSELPPEVRDAMQWRVHDPVDEGRCGYLATTSAGERIYLTRDVTEADLALVVGPIEFDETLGYRGTLSAVYPGLSTAETMRRVLGSGHAELGPDDPRPLRELVDEIGWLLGVQFVLQVVPSADGGVAAVIAGMAESVLSAGKEQLAEHWRVDVRGKAELVVAAVDADAGGHGWRQVAAALDTARRLVARDGRILLLTELSDLPSEGIEMIRDARTPREAVRPVREQARADRVEALQVAMALDRANVYLLSRLPDDLVEDLFMVPVANVEEALKVMEGSEDCVVIGSAQHVFVRHVEEVE